MAQTLVAEQGTAALSAFFAGLALLLASIELYGLMFYTVEPENSRNRDSFGNSRYTCLGPVSPDSESSNNKFRRGEELCGDGHWPLCSV
jgi:hypothetical protein